MRKTLAAAAGLVLVLAVSAPAFENTTWYGPVNWSSNAAARGGPRGKGTGTDPNTTLSTQSTTWNLNGSMLWSYSGDMLMRNAHNYSKSAPTDSDAQASFLLWVHDRILADTGIDVTVIGAELKGKCSLNGPFDMVNMTHKIKYVGTIASGEGAGKDVKGTIKVKGRIPRD